MKKKPISSRSFKRVQESTKASCLSSVLTVARLVTLHQNFLTLKALLKMEKMQESSSKRPLIRKTTIKEIKTSLQKMKIVAPIQVNVKKVRLCS